MKFNHQKKNTENYCNHNLQKKKNYKNIINALNINNAINNKNKQNSEQRNKNKNNYYSEKKIFNQKIINNNSHTIINNHHYNITEINNSNNNNNKNVFGNKYKILINKNNEKPKLDIIGSIDNKKLSINRKIVNYLTTTQKKKIDYESSSLNITIIKNI